MQIYCGQSRWDVKTLNDKDASKINFKPIDTTIAALDTISVPKTEAHTPRLPKERQVYRIRSARVEKYREDHDWSVHVILSQGNARMSVELLNPGCAFGSKYKNIFREQHDRFYGAVDEVPQTWESDVWHMVVDVTGVLFFDVNGKAKLYPVLQMG
jgi:hypothetical protein